MPAGAGVAIDMYSDIVIRVADGKPIAFEVTDISLLPGRAKQAILCADARPTALGRARMTWAMAVTGLNRGRESRDDGYGPESGAPSREATEANLADNGGGWAPRRVPQTEF